MASMGSHYAPVAHGVRHVDTPAAMDAIVAMSQGDKIERISSISLPRCKD
ncbi:MAG: hypothetical protein NTY26_16480 [Burkholderiales bacterium]|nr:hypothetical protein [Burkholderiales bacterium]